MNETIDRQEYDMNDPASWVEAHRARGHEASTTQIAAPGWGTGSYCFTCQEYGPSNGGILTLADVR